MLIREKSPETSVAEPRETGPARLHPMHLLPREHGSWGMLLFPFVSAAIVARNPDWTLAPASVAVLAVFLAREPLTVLFRQRFLWADQRPETMLARRSLVGLGFAFCAAAAWLLSVVPWTWLVALGAGAAGLLGLSIYATLHNLQRSTTLQVVGAAGLSASGFVSYLAAGKGFDTIVLLLWAIHVIHSTGAILVVRARLEAIKALRVAGSVPSHRRAAVRWQFIQGLGVLLLLAAGRPVLAWALLLPMMVHVLDLTYWQEGARLRTPLSRTGFRELGLSLLLSALMIAGLW